MKFDESTTRPKDTPLGASQILVCDAVEGPAEEGALSPEGQTESLEEATKEGKHQIVNLNSSSSQDLNFSQTVSQLVCNKCLLDITGRSVTALGYAWHPDCFQCYVSVTIKILGKLELTEAHTGLWWAACWSLFPLKGTRKRA